MRLLLAILLLSLLLAAPLLIFGDRYDLRLAGESGIAYLRSFGPYAAAIAITLLVADLFLPIPSTIVMSALGVLYGPLLGGLLAALGSVLAGLAAYAAARLIGSRAATRLVGPRDLERAHAFFNRSGGWAIAASRALPLLAETIACLAGLTRMSLRRFLLALASGAIPTGFTFAAIGAAGTSHPLLALAVSAILPLALWLTARRLAR